MSDAFTPVLAGRAAGGNVPAPVTPKNVPYRDGSANPSADALRSRFGAAVSRVDVIWSETTVIVDASRVNEIVRWLHDDPTQR